jgi:hypothetical protein
MSGSTPYETWPIVLGPTPRMIPLEPLIAVLQQASRNPNGGPQLRTLAELGELLNTTESHSQPGRLLLDADATPQTDLGFVTRFLTHHPRWQLWLCGEDDQCRVARTLLALPQTRWCGWPLDLEQLQRLLVASADTPLPSKLSVAPKREEVDRPAHTQPQPSPRGPQTKLEEDLGKIESILAGDTLASEPSPILEHSPKAPDPGELSLTHEELEAFQASIAVNYPADQGTTEHETAEAVEPAPPSSDSAPPRWYRSQVADLADIAQRLDLALNALREQHQEAGGGGDTSGALDDPLERLSHDALRLVQFSRTLGYLAAPPGQGDDLLRLDTLLQETMSGMADTGSGRARFLFRAEGPVEVRSDKGLMVLVLDAVLALANGAAGPDGEVRASAVKVVEEEGSAQAELRISFPAGPLAEIPPPEVLEPYGLRGKLPGLGPNALAAASRILEGQGGGLLYGEGDEPGQALFILSLPCA